MSSYEPYTPSSYPPPPARRTQLVRSRQDRVVGGVCGGFAAFTGIDATLIRVLLVAATVFGLGSPVLLYAAAWLLMPSE